MTKAHRAVLLTSVLVAAGVVVGPLASSTPARAAPGCGRGGLNEAQLDAAFADAGSGRPPAPQQGFGGGDYPHAYPLPDGRVFWMFQDLHFSNDDDLRNDNPVDTANGTATNAAHNAGLIQQGSCFTILGGRGRDLIGDALTVDSRTWFWPLDGEIGVDGNLWIFMVEMHNPSGGGAGFGALPVQHLAGDPRSDDAERAVLRAGARSRRPTSTAGRSRRPTSWSYLYSHCYRQFVNNVDSDRPVRCRVHAATRTWPGCRAGTSSHAGVLERIGMVGDRPRAAVPVASRNVANPMSVQWFGDMFVSVTKEDDWWGTRAVHRPGTRAAGPVDDGADAAGGRRHEVLELRQLRRVPDAVAGPGRAR